MAGSPPLFAFEGRNSRSLTKSFRFKTENRFADVAYGGLQRTYSWMKYYNSELDSRNDKVDEKVLRELLEDVRKSIIRSLNKLNETEEIRNSAEDREIEMYYPEIINASSHVSISHSITLIY